MFISGLPGSGKTATVHAVVRELEQLVADKELPTFQVRLTWSISGKLIVSYTENLANSRPVAHYEFQCRYFLSIVLYISPPSRAERQGM